MARRIHIDRFDTTQDIKGRARTYEAVKARVLEAGRFSVFEATETQANAVMFTDLERDPDIETFRDPPGYPWIGVRLRQK